MSKFPEWTQVDWPYNSEIKLPCYAKTVGGYQVFLHQAYTIKDLNFEKNEWVHRDGFEFTVKGYYSGRCPDTVKTLDEAKEHIDQLGKSGKIY
jgi:hypothetical protein